MLKAFVQQDLGESVDWFLADEDGRQYWDTADESYLIVRAPWLDKVEGESANA